MKLAPLVLVHPFYGLEHQFLKEYESAFPHLTSIRKYLQRTLAPIVLLEEKGRGLASETILQGWAPHANMYGVQTRKADPAPLEGWDSFMNSLESLGGGREVSLAGGFYEAQRTGGCLNRTKTVLEENGWQVEIADGCTFSRASFIGAALALSSLKH